MVYRIFVFIFLLFFSTHSFAQSEIETSIFVAVGQHTKDLKIDGNKAIATTKTQGSVETNTYTYQDCILYERSHVLRESGNHQNSYSIAKYNMRAIRDISLNGLANRRQFRGVVLDVTYHVNDKWYCYNISGIDKDSLPTSVDEKICSSSGERNVHFLDDVNPEQSWLRLVSAFNHIKKSCPSKAF